jgi:hypothetical protein
MTVNMSLRLNGRHYLTHRLVFMVLKGAIAKGLHVRHSCDNPQCVRLDQGSRKLAETYGVSAVHIRHIISGRARPFEEAVA